MCYRTQSLMIQDCIHRLYTGYYQVYGQQQLDYADLMVEVANFALHRILQSDAPYHNVEHTILVTLAGQAILRGKYLSEKTFPPKSGSIILSLYCVMILAILKAFVVKIGLNIESILPEKMEK